MEIMYEYSAAHKFFLYLTSTPTTSEATTITTLVPPPPPPPPPPFEAYDQAYYPTSINDQELMNFKAATEYIHPSPPLAATTAASAPFVPYNQQVQFSGGSSMPMDFSYFQDINEDISSNSSFYFETSREAKVLRYKEKKKRRNFVKKIRYPSRKAYADRRPRIRGRFIKVLESDEQPPSPIALDQYNQDSPLAYSQQEVENQ